MSEQNQEQKDQKTEIVVEEKPMGTYEASENKKSSQEPVKKEIKIPKNRDPRPVITPTDGCCDQDWPFPLVWFCSCCNLQCQFDDEGIY